MEKIQKSMMSWKSVKEALPERGVEVLVKLEDKHTREAFLFHNEWFSNELGVFDCAGDPSYKNKVTQWKLLSE